MWQRVLSNDQQLLADAYRVLSVYNDKWHSTDDFADWLESHDDQVFYSAGDSCDLVVGFRRADDERWQGTVVGVDGDPQVDALPRIFAKTFEYMRDNKTQSLYLHLTSPPRPNPFSDALQKALDYARAQPEVASVSVQPVGRAREYTLTLKS